MINGEFCWEKANFNYCIWLKMRSRRWDVYWDLFFFILSRKNTVAVNGKKHFRKFLFGMPFIFLNLVIFAWFSGATYKTSEALTSPYLCHSEPQLLVLLSPPWHIPGLKAGLQTSASSPQVFFFPWCYCFAFRGYVQHCLFRRTWFLIKYCSPESLLCFKVV